MDEPRDRGEVEDLERERPGALEDLDVPERDGESVKGGQDAVPSYSIRQAWPKKYT